MQRQAFSLVELSIVLVILGLLTGGILAGQSLIRAAQLRAVTTEYQRYATAAQSFRDKYFAIPGDMTNATAFWGYASGTGCTNSSGTAVTTPGTCDGNGNGNLDAAAAASQSGEFVQFWRQLALAGLIEGSYTGLAGPGGVQESVIGTSSPPSKLSGAGWEVFTLNNYVGSLYAYRADYGNYLRIGTQTTTFVGAAAIKPEEAWNIDTKMDDGMPGTGKVIGYSYPNGFYNVSNGTNTCTTSVNQVAYSGSYNLSNSVVQCALIFVKPF